MKSIFATIVFSPLISLASPFDDKVADYSTVKTFTATDLTYKGYPLDSARPDIWCRFLGYDLLLEHSVTEGSMNQQPGMQYAMLHTFGDRISGIYLWNQGLVYRVLSSLTCAKR